MIKPARAVRSVLITGGAGFIGSHVADELLAHGYRVRILDSLVDQVHGGAARPDYLAADVEVVRGDVRDPDAVARALSGCEAVYHFAAMVGVGQSMYQIQRYTSVNNDGTAVLLEALAKHPVERLIVASSMSIYGEGLYRAAQPRRRWHDAQPLDDHHPADAQAYHAVGRTPEQLKRKQWDPVGPHGEPLEPIPTPETKHPNLASVYALSKFDQERLCLIVGGAYGIPTVALRFFNVYGPRQALSNPYTGVLAIFASRLLNGNRPLIFEDGHQQRDFVSVHDVAQACRLALEVPEAANPEHRVFNVGSGQRYTVRQLAEELARVMGRDIEAEVTGDYRVGDIRHCFADIARARHVLGYEPRVTLEEGMAELAAWLEGQVAVDRVAEARAELATRGLTV